MFRETVFRWERARKQSLLKGDLSTARAAQAEIEQAFRATTISIPASIPQYIKLARMGYKMIRQIVCQTDETSLEDHVTDKDFDELKIFVGNLFGVNLGKTTLVRVPANLLSQWSSGESPEATAISCGMDEHLIMLPDSGFQSLDLVAHELGHAAEFIIRRQLGTDWSVLNRPIVSETMAYYAQFHHLLTYGTANRRRGALGAFLVPYLVTQYAFAADEDEHCKQVRNALQTERFSAFRKVDVFTLDILERFLQPYEGRSLQEIYFSPIELRFSIPLALKLLGRPNAMHSLAIANFDVPFVDIFQEHELDHDELLDFTDLDSLFASFIAGCQH